MLLNKLAGIPTVRGAGTPIISFGVASHDEALACAEVGISAFVGADGTIDDLAQAALLALEGKAVVSPTLAALLVQRIAALSEAHSPPNAALTRREQEIARLIDHGLSNKEIAGSLKISPATVKNHVHTILEKLNVSRRNAIGRSLGVNRREEHRRMSPLRESEPASAALSVRPEQASVGRAPQLSLG
jgi:DNA-binding NarL/FixJ family response regulator